MFKLSFSPNNLHKNCFKSPPKNKQLFLQKAIFDMIICYGFNYSSLTFIILFNLNPFLTHSYMVYVFLSNNDYF